jgi:hypothetical protein
VVPQPHLPDFDGFPSKDRKQRRRLFTTLSEYFWPSVRHGTPRRRGDRYFDAVCLLPRSKSKAPRAAAFPLFTNITSTRLRASDAQGLRSASPPPPTYRDSSSIGIFRSLAVRAKRSTRTGFFPAPKSINAFPTSLIRQRFYNFSSLRPPTNFLHWSTRLCI